MKLTAKVIAKEIKSGKTSFYNYSLLTGNGKWYRIAGIDKEDLGVYKGKVVTVEVSRKFDKMVETKDGRTVAVPTLLVEYMADATINELERYQSLIDKLNADTLVDIE